mmetsp:Transcript_23823/g.24810  ORF Transcript_23823/g.24810 Transcript_23823/m.24810 type:complete len:168 (-) Transcript_23823:85-588(-)
MSTPTPDSSAWSTIKEKTGISPIILIAGVLGALTVVFLGHSEKYVTNLTGILFPAYMSMKAIESVDEDDDKQWCTYWVVFFLFELVELYFGYILHLLPFYFLIKLIFLVWLFFPSTSGATFIYEKILSKFFSKIEKDIDRVVDDVGSTVSKGISNAKQAVKSKIGAK